MITRLGIRIRQTMIRIRHLLKYNALCFLNFKKRKSNIQIFLELANVKNNGQKKIMEKELRNETLGHVAPSQKNHERAETNVRQPAFERSASRLPARLKNHAMTSSRTPSYMYLYSPIPYVAPACSTQPLCSACLLACLLTCLLALLPVCLLNTTHRPKNIHPITLPTFT